MPFRRHLISQQGRPFSGVSRQKLGSIEVSGGSAKCARLPQRLQLILQTVTGKKPPGRSGNRVLRLLLLAGLLSSGAGGHLSQQEEQVLLEAAKASLAAGRLPEAIREFDQVRILNPSFSEAHFYLGEAHARASDWDKAVLHVRRAVELDPKSPAYCNQLAMIFVQQKRYKEALPELLSAIELKPVNFPEFYYYNLAGVYRSPLFTDEALRAQVLCGAVGIVRRWRDCGTNIPETAFGANDRVQDLRRVFDNTEIDVVTIATPNHWPRRPNVKRTTRLIPTLTLTDPLEAFAQPWTHGLEKPYATVCLICEDQDGKRAG